MTPPAERGWSHLSEGPCRANVKEQGLIRRAHLAAGQCQKRRRCRKRRRRRAWREEGSAPPGSAQAPAAYPSACPPALSQCVSTCVSCIPAHEVARQGRAAMPTQSGLRSQQNAVSLLHGHAHSCWPFHQVSGNCSAQTIVAPIYTAAVVTGKRPAQQPVRQAMAGGQVLPAVSVTPSSC